MAKNENKEQETLVDLGETGVIELPKIDVSKYIGNKSTIERVTERKGMHGYYVKVESAVIETIGEGEKAIELRASRILGLQQDEKGNIGWGEDTKTAQYLKKMGVAHYKELAGKEVVIQTHMNNGTEFLTF